MNLGTRVLLTVVVILLGSLLLAISKETPMFNSGWIRVLIGTAGGAAMVWIWTRK